MHLKFNTSKCEVLTVTRKCHPFCYQYKLSSNSLKHVTQVKGLGVTISLDLTWDTHINTILAKANGMLAFLRRNSVASFTTDQWKLLYLTFVRPYNGYASEVWAPSTINSITKIESLQRRAINLEPHSVVCPAPSSLVFVSCSNVFFPLVCFSIVIMVNATK